MEELLQAIAISLMSNQEKEAEAVKGYQELIGLLNEAISQADSEMIGYLEKLKAATEEKISDELNHQTELLSEYVAMTGIQPDTD